MRGIACYIVFKIKNRKFFIHQSSLITNIIVSFGEDGFTTKVQIVEANVPVARLYGGI